MLTQEQRLKLKNAGYSDVKINAFEAKKAIKDAEIESQKPTYLQRVGQGIKQGFQSAGQDISSTDNRSALSKGISAVSNVAGGLISPLTEAPGIKQLGGVINKGIEMGGEELSKLYTPEFQQKLASLSDEEFQQVTQPLQDLANTGNIANTILMAKGVKEGAKGIKTGVVKTGETIAETGKKITQPIKKIASDIIPERQRIINEQITKALDLSPGDLNKIARSTGNELGTYLANKNAIGVNKATTVKNLEGLFDNSYKSVREEIGKVKTTYKPSEIQNYKTALSEVNKKVKGVVGLEEVSNEVSSLLKKKTISLNDVQRAKELIDEHFSLYKVTGDVAEQASKQGLANVRQGLKEFIESEVEKGGGKDIRGLNNDVQTSKTILEAIKTRSPKGLTSSNIKIGDLGAFGVGSVYGGPIGGLASVLFKKIVESPTVRLRFAKWLDTLEDAKKIKIQKKLKSGEVPPELVKAVGIQNLTPNISAKKTNTKSISILPNSTTSSLKGKGTIPENSGENVTLYHASPKMPKSGNWKEGTYFADTEQNARYYAESHHTGKISVQKVEVPKDLVQKNKTNNIYQLKSEYPIKNTIPKGNSLLSEAKKYKTAEEFVKAQGKEIYHATDSEPFDVFDISKAKKGENYFNPLGTGQYLSSNKEFVKRFGTNTMEYVLPKNAKTKIVTIDNWVKKDYPIIIKNTLKKLGIKYDSLTLDEKVMLNRQVPDAPIISLNNAEVIIGDIAERFGKKGDIQKIMEQVSDSRNANYDAIIFRDTDSAFNVDEILIPKPSNIKTKSQLTDIWKKANKK